MSLAVAEADEEMKPIMNLLNTLYLATIMEKNISWFVINGILKVASLVLLKLHENLLPEREHQPDEEHLG